MSGFDQVRVSGFSQVRCGFSQVESVLCAAASIRFESVLCRVASVRFESVLCVASVRLESVLCVASVRLESVLCVAASIRFESVLCVASVRFKPVWCAAASITTGSSQCYAVWLRPGSSQRYVWLVSGSGGERGGRRRAGVGNESPDPRPLCSHRSKSGLRGDVRDPGPTTVAAALFNSPTHDTRPLHATAESACDRFSCQSVGNPWTVTDSEVDLWRATALVAPGCERHITHP